MSKMTQSSYNPDVLSCLANLSNDEVFTPPAVVNRMLDLLPVELWSNPEATFLDPVSKTGIFLREIAKRLNFGLAEKIPDQQERIDHIFSRQLYGLAITELTALVSRRSVYCTKTANNKYCVCSCFNDEQGNIRYRRTDHTFRNGKCQYCGASEAVFGGRDDLETHAYQFIHTDNPQEIFNMKFDVIIGNPPYQLDDGGNRNSATPIYNLFVETAIKLNPRYLIMIIPSRWFCGGRGLQSFRELMLTDPHLKYIYDYARSADCFPGIRNGGGICYFCCDAHYDSNNVQIVNHHDGNGDSLIRPKLDFGLDFFIRDNLTYEIVRKVREHSEDSLSRIVFKQKPFGFRTNFTGFEKQGEIKLYTKQTKSGYGYVSISQVEKNAEYINHWKVVTSRSTSVPEEDNGQVLRMSQTFIAEPGSVVSESYIVVAAFKTELEAINCMSYIKTRFLRLLCQITIVSPDVSARTFELVPLQDFSESWTDEKLYAKYNLSTEEIAFIESMIRPME